MRRPGLALVVAIATLLVVSWTAALAAPAPSSTRVIVVLRDGVASPASVATSLGRAHGFEAWHVYAHALKGFAAAVPDGRLAALRADPRVAYVEVDQEARIAEQTVPTGVQRIFAPGNANIDIDGTDDWRVDVDVAVIDTGIDLDHPDLNVVASTNCSGGGPFKQSCGSGGDDDNGHGTHVAGTIGAIDNGIGAVGVAPGARLWAVKVLSGSGSGYISWIVAGIDYVTANASSIEVANMSLGCECSSSAMDTAIANSVAKGVVYSVAAGNSDKDASTFSPANHPDVITVSALADFNGLAGGGAAWTCREDQDDTLADFSNWGSLVEIAAPGVCILSTWPGGGYNTISGTSMASPHVAGAAALLASRSNPNNKTDANTVRSTLMSNGNLNWTDDSGDGIKERLLDVSDTSVFNPVLVAGSGGGGGGGGGGGDPSGTMHVGDLDGTASLKGKSGKWEAVVTVTIHDESEGGVANTSVTVIWSGARNGTVTGTTGSGGTVSFSTGALNGGTTVTLTVAGVSHASLNYDSGANHDPDGDSDGTSITNDKP